MKAQELFKVTLLVSLVLTLLYSEASAQGLVDVLLGNQWQGTLGDWSDDASWDSGEPVASGRAGVANGGTVTVTQLDEECLSLFIFQPGSRVIVSDGGSLDTPELYLTDGGELTLDGGSVTSIRGFLPFLMPGDSCDVSIFGAGSTWNISEDLYIGGSDTAAVGTAQVNVSTGGLLTTDDVLKVWGAGTLTLDGGTVQAGSFDSSLGTLDFTSGTLTVDGGTFDAGTSYTLSSPTSATLALVNGASLSTDVTVSGGGLLQMDTASLAAGSTLTLDGGQLTGDITVDGMIDVATTGDIDARVNIGSTGQLRVLANSVRMQSALASTNAGRIDADGTKLQFAGHLTNEGILNSSDRLALYGGWDNPGTMNFTGHTTVYGNGNIDGGSVFVAGGAVVSMMDDIVHNGSMFTVAGEGNVTFFGDVSGAGSFTGDGGVWFLGTYSPGNSAANVTMTNVTYASSNTLIMELAGLVLGDNYDHITITDSATLDGVLEIVALDDFTPGLGDTFDLFDWPETPTGEYSSILLPTLSNADWSWDTSALYDTGDISVVPEPATLSLLTLGGCLALLWRRRRKL